LPERQRLAVQLIDIEGYGPADVAALLELSPVTVRWHLMAARRKLRRLLAPLGGPESRHDPERNETDTSDHAQHSTDDARDHAVGRQSDNESNER
jgi:Sigma-70, region 4